MTIDISNYLKEITKKFNKENIKEFSANSIAEKNGAESQYSKQLS